MNKHIDFRRRLRMVFLFPAVAALDQAAKALALGMRTRIDLLGIIRLIPPVYNTGAAFSLGRNSGWVMIALTACLIAGICTYLLLHPDVCNAERAGLFLCAGGGLGNLIDRLLRGAVVDFIEFAFFDFPVFNVADICVCAGAALAVIGMLRADRRRKNGGV